MIFVYKAEVDSSSKITADISSSSGTESSATVPIPAQRPAASKSKEASGKLFGSLDDDEDDLFSTLKAKPLQKPKVLNLCFEVYVYVYICLFE